MAPPARPAAATPARRLATTLRLVGALVVLAGALVLAGPPAAGVGRRAWTGGSGARHRTVALSWSSCDGRFRCAELTVPLSYARPSGPTIRLAVIMLPAAPAGGAGARPVGDLVMNPGGPGVSGVDSLAASALAFPAALRARFNLVSFDPRATGRSDPVSCTDQAGLRQWLAADPAPATPTQVHQVVGEVRAFVAGCSRHSPAGILDHAGTAETALDLDRLRSALGQPKLTYLGFSYGTYLGALYEHDFPHRVRAMVLDGAVDPALGTVATDTQQAVGLEADLRDFFAWCDRTAACAQGLPGGASAAFETLTARLAAGATLRADPGEPLGGVQRADFGVAETGIAAGLYSRTDWSYLGQALAAARDGDGTLLTQLADQYDGLGPPGETSNVVSANLAISCVDRPSPSGLASYRTLARTLAAAAPDFGAVEAWGSLPCAYWPVAPTGQVGPVSAPGAPPALVIGSTQDPITPYAWAQSLTRQLRGSVLLTRDGDGHTGYFSSRCIQRVADRYLLTLVMPPPATVCASS